MTAFEKLEKCRAALRRATNFEPKLAVVLGSGLGDFADMVEPVAELPYADIEGFPVSTAPGHAGRFLFGRLAGVPVVLMQGRVHYYEGYDMADVVLPVRLMLSLGAGTLLLTNAAGGINPAFAAGDLMLLSGHIASFVPSPLRGPNEPALGPRFPDMSEVYHPGLRAVFRRAAKAEGLALREGVYLQTAGPQFETPEEITMYKALGADAVGMSTAVEAIAAQHMGARVAALSCISNLAAGISPQPLSAEEVTETAARVGPSFRRLILAAVPGLAE